MPGESSTTGLIAARVRPIYRTKKKKVELCGLAQPAPFVLRPFAGLFNPYPYGCSVLCNHPADYEAKQIVRRAKEYATERRAMFLPVEMEMVAEIGDNEVGNTSVPEELFRKYTDTDSRPLTPVPSLAGSTAFTYKVSRDDPATCYARGRLVLDLRTKEQECETLSWHALTLEPPPSFPRNEIFKATPYHVSPAVSVPPSSPASLLVPANIDHSLQEVSIKVSSKSPDDFDDSASEEMPMRRRGKRRRKRKCRRGSTYGPEVRDPPEPLDTQVSQIDGDSRRASMKPSADEPDGQATLEVQPSLELETALSSSFIPADLLKHLCRDLDLESVEWEFSAKKKVALEEAWRIKKELQLNVRGFRQPSSSQSILQNAPRVFSRQSARFEILDSQSLSDLTPLAYLSKHVFISDNRKFIFSRVFNRHCDENSEGARHMSPKILFVALGEVLGTVLTEEQTAFTISVIGDVARPLNFRSWVGVCSLAERLLPTLPNRDLDPPDWIEQADFETLERRLVNIKNLKLVTLLKLVRDR